MEKAYYVSVVSGRRYSLLYGPCETHNEALAAVSTARRIACEIDPFLDFAEFGTCSRNWDKNKLGKLNKQVDAAIGKT